MSYAVTTIDSPLGPLQAAASSHGLIAIGWPNTAAPVDSCHRLTHDPAHPILARLADQLEAYFDGRRTAFDLALDCAGTVFQRAVWAELRRIGFGQTRTYGQIATAINRPKAARAVGAASARNPLPIITPCHRVVGADGQLTGFAGGLAAKQYLLGLEQGQPTLDLALRTG